MVFRLAGVFLLLTTLSACSKPPYHNLDNKQLKSLLKQNVAIYDIRRPDEWRQTGVVEGSQLLTFVDSNGQLKAGFMAQFTAAVKKDDPVILICRTGNRTRALARYLVEKMGFTQVYNVRNGISHWIREGEPITHI